MKFSQGEATYSPSRISINGTLRSPTGASPGSAAPKADDAATISLTTGTTNTSAAQVYRGRAAIQTQAFKMTLSGESIPNSPPPPPEAPTVNAVDEMSAEERSAKLDGRARELAEQYVEMYAARAPEPMSEDRRAQMVGEVAAFYGKDANRLSRLKNLLAAFSE